jgi:hypothetical protein
MNFLQVPLGDISRILSKDSTFETMFTVIRRAFTASRPSLFRVLRVQELGAAHEWSGVGRPGRASE